MLTKVKRLTLVILSTMTVMYMCEATQAGVATGLNLRVTTTVRLPGHRDSTWYRVQCCRKLHLRVRVTVL